MRTLLESDEQIALVDWAGFTAGRHPELRLLFHIPNGGNLSKAQRGKFKAMGLKAGMPDLCLPVRRGMYGSLFIEMKRIRGRGPSDTQKRVHDELRQAGNRVAVCYGWLDAKSTILSYLEG